MRKINIIAFIYIALPYSYAVPFQIPEIQATEVRNFVNHLYKNLEYIYQQLMTGQNENEQDFQQGLITEDQRNKRTGEMDIAVSNSIWELIADNSTTSEFLKNQWAYLRADHPEDIKKCLEEFIASIKNSLQIHVQNLIPAVAHPAAHHPIPQAEQDPNQNPGTLKRMLLKVRDFFMRHNPFSYINQLPDNRNV
jgi:hypothetical protein